jgi:hypothetical protein
MNVLIVISVSGSNIFGNIPQSGGNSPFGMSFGSTTIPSLGFPNVGLSIRGIATLSFGYTLGSKNIFGSRLAHGYNFAFGSTFNPIFVIPT